MRGAGFWWCVVAGLIVLPLLTLALSPESPQLLRYLFLPIRSLVGNAKAIFVVSGVLFAAALYLRVLGVRNILPLLGAAATWCLFAVWENFCTQQRYSIRVDLILIAPLLLIITLTAVLWSLWMVVQLWRQTSPARNADRRRWQIDSD